MRCALTTDSRLQWLTGGRVHALVQALALTFASVPALGFQALNLPLREILFLAAVAFVAVMLFWSLVAVLRRDVSEPFSVAAAGRLTVFLTGVSSVAVYWRIIWSDREFPGYLRLPFPDAMTEVIDELPERESLVQELVEYLAVLDAAPVWLVLRLDQYPVVGYVLAVYLAIFCFLLASSAVAIAVFCKHYALKGVFHE